MKDLLNYVFINKVLFYINTQGKLANIAPQILLVIPEETEAVVVYAKTLCLFEFTFKVFVNAI